MPQFPNEICDSLTYALEVIRAEEKYNTEKQLKTPLLEVLLGEKAVFKCKVWQTIRQGASIAERKKPERSIFR